MRKFWIYTPKKGHVKVFDRSFYYELMDNINIDGRELSKKIDSIKGIEKIYIESHGYMQYSEDSKWLATVYGGPSVILPIIECDWNDKKSQFIKYMPDQDLVDEYRQMENERRYSNPGYDSDYSY